MKGLLGSVFKVERLSCIAAGTGLIQVFFGHLYPLAMPITTRNKQGKRTRELSNEVEDPNTQLGQETRFTDLVCC